MKDCSIREISNPLKRKLSVLVACVLIISCVSPNRTATGQDLSKEVEVLGGLVNERLSYMKDVAAFKWDNQLAIEDKEREAIVINASQESALEHKLDSSSTRQFFEVQIELANAIQSHWFQTWEKEGFPEYQYRDLTEEIRPEVIRLGDEIIQQIAKVEAASNGKEFSKKHQDLFISFLTTAGLSEEEKAMLFESLKKVRGGL